MWFFGKKKQVTQERVQKALALITHPQKNEDVLQLGMISNIVIGENTVSLDLNLDNPDASIREPLMKRVREAIEQLGASKVTINPKVKPKPVETQKRNLTGIDRIVAIASGKGGVGKSTVCYTLAQTLVAQGKRVGIMDCDIYGPSIPVFCELEGQPPLKPDGRIKPHEVAGMKLISMGYLLEKDEPLMWRGPMTHKVIEQFLYTVDWGILDYLFLDLPPGTGDIQLSLTQLSRIDGSIIVTTPQDVAMADAIKAVQMFDSVKIPVLGFAENMSYYLCGKCDKKHRIFPPAKKGENVLVEIPIDPIFAAAPSKKQSEAISDAFVSLASQLREQLAKLPRRSDPQFLPKDWARPSVRAFEV